MRVTSLLLAGCALGALMSGATASADTPSGGAAPTGGAGVSAPAPGSSTSTSGLPPAPSRPMVPGDRAEIIKGVAYAPADAPTAVKKAIWAGDTIRLKPYIYGGGHGSFHSAGYDCSGSVSYVLHAAGLLRTSMDSGEFESWGRHGTGQWITVYTNPGHAFAEIAGIRLDTSREGDPDPAPGTGPRWRPLMSRTRGYTARHPRGF